MKKRLISSGIGIIIFTIALLFMDTIILNIMISIVSVLSVYEVLKAIGCIKFKLMSGISLFLAGLIPLIKVLGITDIGMLIFSYIFTLFVILIYQHKSIRVEQVGLIFSITVLLPCAFSNVVFIRDRFPSEAILYVLLACGCGWLTDSGAYFAGKFFGKTKLAPLISPKKTVEGAVGGVITCIVFSIILTVIGSLITKSLGYSITINYVLLIIVTTICSIVGMFGDLSASIIKRQFNVKDFGSIMPGHGGILDRFDSVMFTVPVFYLLVQYLTVITIK